MAFMTLSDETTEISAVVFPEVYRSKNQILQEDAIVELSIKITKRNNERQVIVNKVEKLDLEADKKQLFIRVKEELANTTYNKIKSIIKNDQGKVPIILHFEKTKKTFKLNESYLNSASDDLISQFKAYFGEENVVLNIEKKYHNQ